MAFPEQNRTYPGMRYAIGIHAINVDHSSDWFSRGIQTLSALRVTKRLPYPAQNPFARENAGNYFKVVRRVGMSHHVCFPNTRLLFFLSTSRLAVSLPAVPENGLRRAKLEPLFHQSQVSASLTVSSLNCNSLFSVAAIFSGNVFNVAHLNSTEIALEITNKNEELIRRHMR